jgi:hypothetical protein
VTEEHGLVHYPSAKAYREFWDFRAVDNVGKQYVMDHLNGNSIVAQIRQKYLMLGRTGLGIKPEYQYRKNGGHFGPAARPDYMQARQETGILAFQEEPGATFR